jgi:hypothetical protein
MAGIRPSPIHPSRDSQTALMGRARFNSQSKSAPGASEAKPTAMISMGLDWRTLDARIRESLRVEHYSYRTEQTYVSWIRRFVLFQIEAVLFIMVTASNHHQIIMINCINQAVSFIDAA